ncbi:MAG: hypothetical protein Q4G46_15585, partial [Propionibacteriaceae bacterium]|nr:hypothetical protein [Propionibacteriaceae bacterium]
MPVWSSLIPFIAVTLALLFVPGTLVNLAGGFRPLSAIGFAPLVSTGIIAFAAIAGQLVGLAWGPIPIVITTVASALLGVGVRLVFRRFGIGGPPPPPDPATRVHLGWPVAGVLLGFGIIGRDMMVILGSPTNFSQTFDNIFHLNAVRWITEHRMGSALDMRMTSGLDTAAGFYPTAWHDIASGTLLTMNAMDPVRATSALLIVVTAVVWPISCLLLVRRLVVPTRTNQLALGVLAASFSAFPYLLVGFGVLYPNLLGLCLLPAVMALGTDILGLSQTPTPALAATWVAAAIGMFALVIAHPNVALVLTDVVGVIMVVYWAVPAVWRAWRTRTWTKPTKIKLVVLIGWLAGAMVALKVVRPPIEAGRWANPRNVIDALIETASVSPLEATIVVVPALLTLLGALVAIITRRYVLLVLLHAGLCFLWFVAAAVPISFFRDLITGSWYSDPYRLASLLPISALPLAVVGLDFLVEKLPVGRLKSLPGAVIPIAVAVLLIAG